MYIYILSNSIQRVKTLSKTIIFFSHATFGASPDVCRKPVAHQYTAVLGKRAALSLPWTSALIREDLGRTGDFRRSDRSREPSPSTVNRI